MDQYTKPNKYGGKTSFYYVPDEAKNNMWRLEFYANITNDVFEVKVKEANFLYYKTVAESLVKGNIYDAIYESWELIDKT